MRGSWGAAPAEGLEPQKGDLVVEKMRMNAWEGTRLESLLKGLGRDTVIVTGAWTNMSVEHTARTGADKGYYMVVPEDGCSTTERRVAQRLDQLRAAERLDRDDLRAVTEALSGVPAESDGRARGPAQPASLAPPLDYRCSMTVVALPLVRRQAYLDGAWVDADSGETFPVVNPATGETIADVPRMGAAETRRAIEAAQARAIRSGGRAREGARASIMRRSPT